MAKTRRRGRRVKVVNLSKLRGAREFVLYERKGKRLRAVILPPGSSTGVHLEKKDYDVVPFTRGTLQVEIFETARQRKPTKVETHKLRPYRKYRRKVGRAKPRGSKYIDATNTGNDDIIIFKN